MACRLKHGTKSVMAANGYHATFMTKPRDADAASAFIFRFTVHTSDGHNAFYDETKKDKISGMSFVLNIVYISSPKTIGNKLNSLLAKFICLHRIR